MKKAEFLDLVMDEIDHVKKHSTAEEKNNLNIRTFDCSNAGSCLYGQMTGTATSARAKELYPKTFVDVPNFDVYIPFSKQSLAGGTDLSALEKYLYMVKLPTHMEIIDYIQGRTNTLNLT